MVSKEIRGGPGDLGIDQITPEGIKAGVLAITDIAPELEQIAPMIADYAAWRWSRGEEEGAVLTLRWKLDLTGANRVLAVMRTASYQPSEPERGESQ